MPLHNRYVVAAVDTQSEQLAFVTQSLDWVSVVSLREAAIFQSHQDAKHFIEENKVDKIAAENTPAFEDFDHVQPVFVTVSGKDAYDFSRGPDGAEEAPTMCGIYG